MKVAFSSLQVSGAYAPVTAAAPTLTCLPSLPFDCHHAKRSHIFKPCFPLRASVMEVPKALCLESSCPGSTFLKTVPCGYLLVLRVFQRGPGENYVN